MSTRHFTNYIFILCITVTCSTKSLDYKFSQDYDFFSFVAFEDSVMCLREIYLIGKKLLP